MSEVYRVRFASALIFRGQRCRKRSFADVADYERDNTISMTEKGEAYTRASRQQILRLRLSR
jgi:hypothetical protein